jgi:hypothetical protein
LRSFGELRRPGIPRWKDEWKFEGEETGCRWISQGRYILRCGWRYIGIQEAGILVFDVLPFVMWRGG